MNIWADMHEIATSFHRLKYIKIFTKKIQNFEKASLPLPSVR